ncbi:MAG TPA: response regulator [Actinomycetota bacterium]|nr:response regulator [Actinomycetota bacterium]
MSEQVSTEHALELVNELHEWVIALEGASFDPAAMVEADRLAIEVLEAGHGRDKAIEAGKTCYITQLSDLPARVLVVDDESDVRVLLRLHIDRPGMSVIAEAATGADAIKAVDEQRPDIVVLDLNMPVLDGVEALKVIKERWPGTNVVVHTAFGELFKPKLAGIEYEGFVEKSGSFQEVTDKIEALVS